MDLFYLDKAVVNFFTNLSDYNIFIISVGALIGTYLYCGNYYSNHKGSKKR